jgi:hypothetical protein
VRLQEAEDWAKEELDGIGESDDEGQIHLKPKAESGRMEPYSIERWQGQVKRMLTQQISYGSVGRHLLDLILTMDGAMGEFARRYASTQPPPTARSTTERRGDVLPIHPSSVSTALKGVSADNLHRGHRHDACLLLLLWVDETHLRPH